MLHLRRSRDHRSQRESESLMPDIRYYTVEQTRRVRVRVVPTSSETYEQAALRKATEGFENPGQFKEGMVPGMESMPEIIEVKIRKDS